MSRIGKNPIAIPSGVQTTIDGQHVEVKGPKGTLSVDVPAPITVAVERRVDAHRQAEALAWVQTGTSLASRMPGYLGSGWVRANGSSSLWYTLYRVADAGSLAAWESSAERHWWLRSGEEFVHDARVERRTPAAATTQSAARAAAAR